MNLMQMPLMRLCCVFILLGIFGTTVRPEASASDNSYDALVVTVASESTDGFLRYMRSARVYDIPVMVLGMEEQWKGGNMQGRGGGYKINLLREALETYKDDSKKIVIFTDSYDVVFTAGLDQIVPNFLKTDARILFSAEKYCWPAPELSEKYPAVENSASRFLNSGGFIGYASELYKLLASPLKDTDDDQLYYTKAYLNESLRESLGMQLDTKSVIFQNLNGAKDDVKLNVNLESNEGVLENIRFNTKPFIIHGNGPSKLELNSYANYLAKTFNGECLICQENRLELDESKLPIISLAIINTVPVPFFDMFLKKIEALNYPKQKIHLFVYCRGEFNEPLAKSFVNRLQKEYLSAKIILHSDELTEHRARQLAVQQARSKNSDYIFFVDADAHIDDAELLRELLITNKQFIAPVFTKHNELWSNFWGAMSDTGYYARSHDYVDIVKQQIVGMWNMPYVSSVYLIKNSAFKHLNYDHAHFDADMAICHSLRQAGVFLNVMNTRIFGHLVNVDDFDTSVTRADFYTLFSNKYDWIKKYIHEEYAKQLEDNVTIPQPCTDVFWFRIGTDAFCDDIVAIMEAYGKWSDGSNKDQRLEGGYEAVPTRDIHMKQVGLDLLWLQFLQIFVRPLQEKVFAGYFHNPPRSLMNFVVRYRPDEQPFLRPHHDSSTYTINIALNQVDVDYEGGGCRFLRYNCSVQATRKGWMLMHPGRLTHYHEGLRTTNGTRYIMISFVDP